MGGWEIAGPSLALACVAVVVNVLLWRRLRAERLRRAEAESRATQARARATADVDAMEKLASVGLVAASVAHEVNNPAAYALANLALARDALRAPGGAENESAATAIDDALDGIRRIRDVVGNLRTLVQKGSDEKERVSLPGVVATAVSLTAPVLRDRAQVDIEAAEKTDVLGHPGNLARALINVIVNAAESMPEGTRGHVVVRTFRRDGLAVIEVSDDGPGIEPQRMGSLFSPMHSTKPTGTGLGLPICRRIVEEHDGRIEVESFVGRGTLFRFVLPELAATSEPLEARRPSSRPPPPAPAPKSRPLKGDGAPLVLVIDDERLFVRVLERYLSRRFRVASMTSAMAAIDYVTKGARPDIVLCDLVMPEKNGAELYGALCAAAPELAARITFMTGAGSDDALALFAKRTGCPCLSKPIEPEELVRHIEERVALRA